MTSCINLKVLLLIGVAWLSAWSGDGQWVSVGKEAKRVAGRAMLPFWLLLSPFFFCSRFLLLLLPLPLPLLLLLLATNHDNKFQFYLVSEAAKHPCHRQRLAAAPPGRGRSGAAAPKKGKRFIWLGKRASSPLLQLLGLTVYFYDFLFYIFFVFFFFVYATFWLLLLGHARALE